MYIFSQYEVFMETSPSPTIFDSASRRVVSTYCRMLCDFSPQPGSQPGQAQQRDLHNFFAALYAELFTAPEEFGLPAAAEIYLIEDHSKTGPNKTDVKKVLDKQRKVIEEGLSLLAAAAREGRVDGSALVLDPACAALETLKKKAGKTWAKGMQRAGLVITPTAAQTAITNPRFPHMMPALQALAQSCAACPDPGLGQVFFNRCDFRALAGDFSVDALELFSIFPAVDFAWAAEMHQFFTGRGYQAQVEIGRMFFWTVKYQGKRSIKATPLFQVDFDERMLRQMHAAIKCASAPRITPLLSQQSQALRDDFAHRANTCGGCSWCATRPHLGPVEFEYQGETRKICWYISPDIKQISPQSADLVKEYALMHESLG
jgi:hypothetical protein